MPHVINLKNLLCLNIHNTGSSEADLNYVRYTVQQALPELDFGDDDDDFDFDDDDDDEDDDDDDDNDDDESGDDDDDEDDG